MSQPDQSHGQKPESRMNWMTLLILATFGALVLYGITSGVINAIEKQRAEEAAAQKQAEPQQAEAPAETAAAEQAAAPADGKEVYGRVCVACHQAEGTGVPGAFPPLAGSEWVSGDAEKLAKILLHGLTGPVTVKGQKFDSTMPAWGGSLNDNEIAAVLTYVRSNFGNSADAVDATLIKQVREATAAQKAPYTADQLK